MKRLLIAFLLGCAAVLIAQQTISYQIPVWSVARKGYVYMTPEQFVSLLPIPKPAVRHYHVPLTFDAARGGWPIPTGAKNVVAWAGLPLFEGIDYDLTAGVIVPRQPDALPANCGVMVDYDE